MPPPDCGFQIAPPPQPHAPPAPCSCGDPILYLHGANKLPRHQGFGPRGGAETLGTRHSARNQKQPPSVCTMQKPPDTAQPPGHPNVTGGLLLILDFYQIGLPLAFYSVIRSRIPDSGRDISAQSPLKHQLHIRFRLLQYFARGCRVLSHICECCLELARYLFS